RLELHFARAYGSADDQIADRHTWTVELKGGDAANDAADAAFTVRHRKNDAIFFGVHLHHPRKDGGAFVAFLRRELLRRYGRRDAAPLLVHDGHADGVVQRLIDEALDFRGHEHADLVAARLLISPGRE